MFDISHPEVRSAVAQALAEDIGSGDVTSRLTIPTDLQARGTFIAKQELVLAGIELLPVVYEMRGGATVELLRKADPNCRQAQPLLAFRVAPARFCNANVSRSTSCSV